MKLTVMMVTMIEKTVMNENDDSDGEDSDE